jgi:D-alanyl-D-alanine carboxypeptidase
MKKFNIFTVLITVMALAAASVMPVAQALDDPAIKADSALLVEKETGIVLYQKNKDQQVEPAGAARIMTLLLALEDIENGQASLIDSVTPSETFKQTIAEDADVVGIRSGETMLLEICCTAPISFREAMRAVLLPSIWRQR